MQAENSPRDVLDVALEVVVESLEPTLATDGALEPPQPAASKASPPTARTHEER